MATVQLPKVQITTVFSQALAQIGYNSTAFAAGFATWKASAATAGVKDPFYGKDDPYTRPLGNKGQTLLWHVHIRPENRPNEVLDWDQRTRDGQVKTSDAVLIYTFEPQYGYLLLWALRESGAHAFARMSTPEATSSMRSLATIAEEFMFWGRVVA